MFFQVLHAGEDSIGIEQLDEDVDDITRNRFTRRYGNMSNISGAEGRLYYEYRCVLQRMTRITWSVCIFSEYYNLACIEVLVLRAEFGESVMTAQF